METGSGRRHDSLRDVLNTPNRYRVYLGGGSPNTNSEVVNTGDRERPVLPSTHSTPLVRGGEGERGEGGRSVRSAIMGPPLPPSFQHGFEWALLSPTGWLIELLEVHDKSLWRVSVIRGGTVCWNWHVTPHSICVIHMLFLLANFTVKARLSKFRKLGIKSLVAENVQNTNPTVNCNVE